jgi:hypothetical protein
MPQTKKPTNKQLEKLVLKLQGLLGVLSSFLPFSKETPNFKS